MYGEVCFSPKYTCKWARNGFATTNLNKKKTINKVEIHWLSKKEQVLGAVVNKEGHADDSVLGHERIHHDWFP